MRVVCLGTIGNFAALSVDPRHLKKEVCMAETLCGICKTRTATVIENKTDKLCSRCYYSRYMFRLPKSQSSRRRASFPVDSSYYYMGIGNCWQSQGIGNHWQSLGIGKRRQSAILGNRQSQGIVAGMRECVGNHRELGMQGIRESAILGNHGESPAIGIRQCRNLPAIRECRGNWQSQGIMGNPRQLAITGIHNRQFPLYLGDSGDSSV